MQFFAALLGVLLTFIVILDLSFALNENAKGETQEQESSKIRLEDFRENAHIPVTAHSAPKISVTFRSGKPEKVEKHSGTTHGESGESLPSHPGPLKLNARPTWNSTSMDFMTPRSLEEGRSYEHTLSFFSSVIWKVITSIILVKGVEYAGYLFGPLFSQVVWGTGNEESFHSDFKFGGSFAHPFAHYAYGWKGPNQYPTHGRRPEHGPFFQVGPTYAHKDKALYKYSKYAKKYGKKYAKWAAKYHPTGNIYYPGNKYWDGSHRIIDHKAVKYGNPYGRRRR